MRLRHIGLAHDEAPPLEQLELRRREEDSSMEMLLLWKGRIAGHVRAHLADASLIYRDGPIGTRWAQEILTDAMSEWACERLLWQG